MGRNVRQVLLYKCHSGKTHTRWKMLVILFPTDLTDLSNIAQWLNLPGLVSLAWLEEVCKVDSYCSVKVQPANKCAAKKLKKTGTGTEKLLIWLRINWLWAQQQRNSRSLFNFLFILLCHVVSVYTQTTFLCTVLWTLHKTEATTWTSYLNSDMRSNWNVVFTLIWLLIQMDGNTNKSIGCPQKNAKFTNIVCKLVMIILVHPHINVTQHLLSAH